MQSLADELFDQAVNLGTKRPVVHFQVGLNVLNRQGSLYPDLHVDGVMGAETLHALFALFKVDGALRSTQRLNKMMNSQQCCHYLERCLQDPSQEVFLRGWLERVVLPEKVIRVYGRTAAPLNRV